MFKLLIPRGVVPPGIASSNGGHWGIVMGEGKKKRSNPANPKPVVSS
jgi:hypothetical protein